MSRTFTVTAERGQSGWWVTECTEAGCVSQVRRLDQAADDMREAIAYQTGLFEDEFDIDVVPALPEAYLRSASNSERLRHEAFEANRAAADASRTAAKALRDAGFTVRDIGSVMGVSHQRAAQLVS